MKLVTVCAKIEIDEAEQLDKWANSLSLTRSAALRYLVTTLLKAPAEDNRAKQLSWAVEMAKREGVIEGINLFRKAFSRAVEEVSASALEDKE